MDKIKIDLVQLLIDTDQYLKNCNETELEIKPAPNKWSKKEIFGHLIDSALNNLQRFTEVQFSEQPYKIRPYKQDELVQSNNYQNVELSQLLNLWLSLNRQILNVFELYNEKLLNHKIITEDLNKVDLKFWANDYVNHMEYHLKQIFAK